jgi:putative peptide maturation dehydrogenase
MASSVRVRRRRFLLLRVADDTELDFGQFLTGSVEFKRETRCTLLCPVRGESMALTAEELGLVMQVPAHEWVSLHELDQLTENARACLLDLVRRGVLLSDPAPPECADLVAGEEALERMQWEDLAAVYQANTQWRGNAVGRQATPLGEDVKEMACDHLRQIRGEAPPHFVVRSDAQRHLALRVPALTDPFFDLLAARRTCRAYRTELPLPQSALETLLYTVFGTRGTKHAGAGLVLARRTSPSGGALHPIDAYVLAIHVEGVPAGLHHYEPATHALAQLELMDVDSARDLAVTFTAGQGYFAEAHALVIHVARFQRSFWKYAQHRKAYKAVLMDSGHLSQTFYLTATQLKLGAFYTAAINDADIGQRLRLEPPREAAIAINGCGIPDPMRQELSFAPDPYYPVASH